MENKKKFLSMKDWGTKDYKKNGILGILMGIIGNMSGIIFVEIIGGVLLIVGIILLIIWVYKFNKDKKKI
jgi:Na+(H+)/acetate symporter ActP